jgi:hypothetical protein
MLQCSRCGGWFGLSWTCGACQQLTRYLWKATR